jgi:excisionase family DNA binding protein
VVDVSLRDLPEVLTIEEAAEVLRIGRTAAYGLARQWRATGGQAGLPVVELGRTLRVPRSALEQLLTGRPDGPPAPYLRLLDGEEPSAEGGSGGRP